MKRIYSILRPPIYQKSYVEWITKRDQKLSVSTRGLIAFTSSFCLNQRHPASISYHVYVADINTPYKPYLIAESESEFSIIEWDPSGTKLLVCDVRGCAIIYTSKDYLVSDWKQYFSQVFAAETFITASWYHPGIISNISIANQNIKNPSNHLEYSEKIQQSKYGASLRLFGGKSAEGCVLISQTGLVCCLSLMTDGTIDVVSESLAPLRSRVEIADICHCKDGSFLVATSTGSISSTISFYQLHLSPKNLTLDEVDMFTNGEGRRVNVTSKQFKSFHPNIMSQMLSERENPTTFERVSHVKFVTKDSPDDVLIEVSGQNLSLIELWELESKKKHPIHSAILDFKNTDDVKLNSAARTDENGNQDKSSKDWTFKGNYITDKDLVAIQVPRFKIFGDNRQLNIFILTYRDSTMCCMRKEDLQPIQASLELSTTHSPKSSTGRSDIDISPYKVYQNRGNNMKPNIKGSNDKKHKLAFITDVQFSCNQTVFVAIDSTSQLHVGRLPTLVTCHDAKDEETYLQYLLEYCLVTGNDWWDAMVCAAPESIESICDKFHDAYERQPKHVQRKYFNRQLMIRASLYRCYNSVQSLCKSSDCHTMIMLNSIASTLKSTLRSQDQDSPGDNLSNFLKTQGMQPNFFNCNNVISKINSNEFYVEANLIQCLQPLNQWIVDLATYLVVSLPQRVKFRTLLPGAGLAHDKEALEILRELLIIIKIWGSQNEASLPTMYKLNDQIDVVSNLFRIISICLTTLGNESDESLIEDCIQLSNSISVPQFIFTLAPVGVASPLYHKRQQQTQQHPQNHTPNINQNSDDYLVLEYFKEPCMPELAKLEKVDGAINMVGNRKIDVVRNISLGAHPVSNVRHCTRCNSLSLINPTSNPFQTTRAWEQRWISSCVCGGSWVQSDSTFVNKVGYLGRSHHNSTISSLSHAHQLVR